MVDLKGILKRARRQPHTSSSTLQNNQLEYPKRTTEGSQLPFSFPDGVKVLHECPDATVDICFVHGLTGNRDSTWTAHGQSTPWPKTLLPSELSSARILTYGYDAYVVRKSVAGSNRLIDHATNLLNDLTTDRARHNASSRALIFIAHSLGGLVCKKAILLSQDHPESHLRGIFSCTKGVVFMGTPHRGAWMADWAKIPAKTLGLVKATNKSMLKILETDDQLLEAIQVGFWSMIRKLRESGRRFEVTCFFEELPLPLVGKIVSKESATLEGYSSFSIHANHSDMVKFSSASDTGFTRLLGELCRWESDISAPFIVDDRDRQCLKDLWTIDLEVEKIRIQQTKGGLLEDVYSWVLEHPDFQQWRDDQQDRLLWIRGDPGKGKTMLLCGIIDELKNSIGQSGLLSFFFCQATDSRINNATAVLRGLIRQLIDQQPSLISHIREKYDLYENTHSWFALSGIFNDILKDNTLKTTFLVIDGLDECQDGLPELLEMVRKWSSYSHVKWIVSSRNWPSIQERLDTAEQLSLELNAESVSTAVGLYIKHKVHQLVKLKKYDSKTQNAVQQHLSENANGTFLWVALVYQYLERTRLNPLAKMKIFPPGLDSLYGRMIQEIRESDDKDICKEILGFMAIVYRPITLRELASFIKIPEGVFDEVEYLEDAISICGSFLTVRESTVYFVHQSARDFLVTKVCHEIFPSGKEEVHYTIFSRSLHTMSRTLQRDIYSLCSPGFAITRVKPPDPDPLLAVQYSCTYWVDHLHDYHSCGIVERGKDFQDGGMIDKFLRRNYLHWLEALSLLGSTSEGVLSMLRLEDLVQESAKGSGLFDLIRDARRFILYHKGAIENSPLQVYTSALVFSPACSVTRELFELEEPKWITTKPVMEYTWNACLQTLEGHGNSVSSVTFSYDSKLLASASGDQTVKIWDTSSGKCLQTFDGHSDWVEAVTFSHDSRLLASASGDQTVKIWDTSSGKCLQILKGHSNWVYSVIFSHDSRLLASSSRDRKVKVWDTSSGQCLQTFDGHSDWVGAVTFSHDSRLLASASGDRTVKIWDASSGNCLQTFDGHSSSVHSVTFSHDSKLLASASSDQTVKIWDTSSSKYLETLDSHSSSVQSIIFSHDSKLLASASHDSTVKIWDASSAKCLQTLSGHRDSVKLVIFSHDSKLLASASYDRKVKIWDTSSGKCLQTLKGHSGLVHLVAFSHNSKLLASASSSKIVKIWDTSSGKCLQILDGHSKSVHSVTFSHDSKLLASSSHDQKVKVWDTSSGQCLQTFDGHSDWVGAVSFSHDSRFLVSASGDQTVKIWDARSGNCLLTLEGHSSSVESVIFSHDSSLLASASSDQTVKIWDASSGKCWQTFTIGKPLSLISFDITKSYLNTEIGTIAIPSVLDIIPTKIDTGRPQTQGYGVSVDGAWITWNSENLLWLPPEYRPSNQPYQLPCSAVAASTVSIGCPSGRVLIFNFDSQHLLHSLARY